MAAYDHEEQEQLEEIKTWWRVYGNRVINVVAAVAIAVAGWQGWNWYQNNRAAQASAIFSVLQNAVQANDVQRIKATSGELLDKFSRTSYASLGALTAAKALVEAGEASSAKLQLSWLVEHGKDEMRDMGRLRLATLLLDEKQYDEALKVLEGKVASGFEARFADTRGDLLVAQGKKTEAAAAYQAALKNLDKTQGSEQRFGQSSAVYREILRQKLDSLGVEGVA